ncbi:MAG: Type 1 glutamine amidotransferase-like domain-containing protein [Actinomycetes bacterium]
MSTYLIGGGWAGEAREAVYGRFLAAAGETPTVACVVLDEGDGHAQFERWAGALTAVGRCDPNPVLVREGAVLDVAALGEADAVLVCGGLTPAYAAALAPVAAQLTAWLDDDERPYAGFSAGAAVAARRAVVGGWLSDGVPICPEDAAEDLDELDCVPGLGLVPFAVDVHAAQWGTLARLVEAVRRGDVAEGIAIDENTMVDVRDGHVLVHGLGRAHRVRRVRRAGAGVEVVSARDGERLDTLPGLP